MADQSSNTMVNMNEEDEEEVGDDNDKDNHNNDNGNGKDDEENDKMKSHESRGDKGSNNSTSMATLLAEIHRGGEEHNQRGVLQMIHTKVVLTKWQEVHMFPIKAL